MAAGAIQAQLLPGPGVIQSEGGPEAIVLADLDGDQLLDLIVTSRESNRVNLHYGSGNGVFRFPVSIFVGSALSELAVGDVDGNLAADLLGLDELSGDLVIVHRYPETTIPYRVTRIPGEDEPNSLLLQDLEGDGDLDVLVAYGGADEVGIYRNLGNQFARLDHRAVGDGPASLRLLGGSQPGYAVAQRGVLSRNVVLYDRNWSALQVLPLHPIADIRPILWDADAELDLLFLDQGGAAKVYLRSSGAWNPGPTWAVSPGATQILPFDSGSGAPGAAVLEAENNRISVHVANAPGVAPDPAWYLGGGVSRMAMGDADRDGSAEYYVPLPEDDLILVFRRIGDGLRGYRSVRTGVLPSRVRSHAAIGGLPPRLFTLCVGSDAISRLELLEGELVPAPALEVREGTREFRVGQVDGDGLPDVVSLSLDDGVQIFFSEGDGFAAPLDVPIQGDLRDLELLHVDDDGMLDLAVIDYTIPGVRLFHGDGSGAYTAGDTLIGLDPPLFLRTRDFDLDGRDDLLAIGFDRRPSLFYRNADGSYQRTSWLLGNDLRGVAIGRFNEDDYPDIAIGNAGDQTYTVLCSVLPRFMAPTELDRAAPDGSEAMAAIDVDGDGLDELVMTSSTSRSVSVHSARGGGIFAPPSRVRCSTLPLDVHAFDADGDGAQDVVVPDGLGASLVILQSLGGAPEIGGGGGATATAGASALGRLRVHPNPAHGPMSMRIHSATVAPSFRVYDLRGRLVARLQAREEQSGWYVAEWAGEDVAAGRYYLQVRAGDAQLSQPLLRLPR